MLDRFSGMSTIALAMRIAYGSEDQFSLQTLCGVVLPVAAGDSVSERVAVTRHGEQGRSVPPQLLGTPPDPAALAEGWPEAGLRPAAHHQTRYVCSSCWAPHPTQLHWLKDGLRLDSGRRLTIRQGMYVAAAGRPTRPSCTG